MVWSKELGTRWPSKCSAKEASSWTFSLPEILIWLKFDAPGPNFNTFWHIDTKRSSISLGTTYFLNGRWNPRCCKLWSWDSKSVTFANSSSWLLKCFGSWAVSDGRTSGDLGFLSPKLCCTLSFFGRLQTPRAGLSCWRILWKRRYCYDQNITYTKLREIRVEADLIIF